MVISIINGHEDGYQHVLDVRNAVLKKPEFVGVTPEVIDRDKQSVHFLLQEEGKPIGTVSLLAQGDKGILRQMAVLPGQREKGLGRTLVGALEEYADQQGIKAIELEARTTALGFYSRNHYKPASKGYFIDGVAHMRMSKPLMQR